LSAIARHPLLLHVRLLWHAAPGLSLCCLILTVLQSLSIVTAMVCSGRLLGALAEAIAGSDPSPVWRWLIATAAAFVAGPLFASVSNGLEELVSARYLSAYQDQLLDTAAAPYTVARLRSEAGSQALDNAAGALQDWLFLRGLRGIWGVIGARLAGVGSLVIIIGWRWWVALTLLLGWVALSRAVARWRSAVFDDTMGLTLPLRHRAAYIYRLVAGRDSAKEVRLFGLADWLVGGYVGLARDAMALVARHRGRAVIGIIAPLTILLGLNAAAFALLTRDAAAGTVSIAGLATMVQALIGISAFGQQDDNESSLGRTSTVLSRLVEFRRSLGLPFPHRAPRDPDPRPAGDRAARIEVRNLTFGYPGSSEPVLQDLDLSVEAGECVAVVGANGTGKSTLLGLLCGLWLPESGSIRIDGRDPGVDALARARIAPIFQRFLRMPLSARDNMTAGNSWLPQTGWQAAAADAGADMVVNNLVAGADTVLSPEFTGGTGLSGGQWQRVALARAFTAVRAGAGVLALDEPTAALDVRAEVALFESVLGHRGSTTTLLITHRLSSVRHADRILVLGHPPGSRGACVIESGSHDELIDLGGVYAHMFGLQAARFQGDVS
jgi:ATP-binding cassette subfamily B protein